jgi:hypothetical protein
MSAVYTPLRALTPFEAEVVARMHVEAARSPVAQDALFKELVVAREVIKEVRRVRRCLPAKADAALDGLPHRRATAVEFTGN